MTWTAPIVFQGTLVRLEPLSSKHHDGLVDAVRDGELWRLWYTSVPSPEGMRAAIDRMLAEQAAGTRVPFTVVENESGQVVGFTTYMNIDGANRRLEIGATWYRLRVQRTAVNTQAKLLLLSHAFEALNCIAVEFRTHVFNRHSRRAIERLGAKLDGILRSHQLGRDGTLRDTCVYSIVAAEWPTVKTHLQWLLTRPR